MLELTSFDNIWKQNDFKTLWDVALELCKIHWNMGMETHGAKSFFFFENYSKYHVLNNSKSFYHDSNTGWALVKLVTLYDS